MTMRKNYGYKICYKEQGSKEYIRYFMTYTYKQAINAMNGYIRYPPQERNTGRKLIHPKWKVMPITKKEVIGGIWQECPF